MTMGPDLRIATLNDARSRRSAEKRAAVEDAVLRLRDSKQAVTFVSVAREAKVSRQYLYNNFADEIGEERVETRAETEVIDGKKVPLRTPEEYRHIEAALRSGGRPGARPAAAPGLSLDEAYAVLEVAAEASDAEVTKAYRRQLSRHHPDKLQANGLPDSMIEHAKQRTQQIIAAWERVREMRGMRG